MIKVCDYVVIVDIDKEDGSYELKERFIGKKVQLFEITSLHDKNYIGCTIVIDSKQYTFQKIKIKKV